MKRTLTQVAIAANVLNIAWMCIVIIALFSSDASPWPGVLWFFAGLIAAALTLLSCLLKTSAGMLAPTAVCAIVLNLGVLLYFVSAMIDKAELVSWPDHLMSHAVPILAPSTGLLALFRLKRHWSYPRCASCGYDMTGLNSSKCPECGTEVPKPEVPPA